MGERVSILIRSPREKDLPSGCARNRLHKFPFSIFAALEILEPLKMVWGV
jgi:hypothetical protein